MKLEDDDMMPIGAFKDKTMANVPGDYLLRLEKYIEKEFQKPYNERTQAILDYIEDNREILQKEAEK